MGRHHPAIASSPPLAPRSPICPPNYTAHPVPRTSRDTRKALARLPIWSDPQPAPTSSEQGGNSGPVRAGRKFRANLRLHPHKRRPLPKPDPAPPPPTDTGWMRRPLAPTVPPAQRQPGCSPQNGALKCVCIGGAPSKVFSAPYTQTQTGVHKRALSPPPCAPHRPTQPTPTRTRARAQSAHGYPPQKGLPRVAARCRNVFARNMLQRRSE